MSGPGRLEALKAALADLPDANEPYEKRHPLFKQVGPDEFEYLGVDYDGRIDRLFETFRSGVFGLAEGDREYLSSLKAGGGIDDEFRAEAVAAFNRETCLLWLRYFDRQERFCDGLRAGVHRDGLLHAILERLIEFEDQERQALP